jgi:hypothetical protein
VAPVANSESTVEPPESDTVRRQMPTTERQVFFAALAELARRRRMNEAPMHAPDLTSCELSVFSQNGEDGVLLEILRRVGEGRREFVEFGAERGVEGNCTALADIFAWSGLFIEADEDKAMSLAWKYRDYASVRTLRARVTAENINELFAAHHVSTEPDLLSIDVDGNDLWLWKALTSVAPRIVVIEYNAHLDHSRPLVQPYDPDWEWGGTDYFGASLGALATIAAEKRYVLVHTELAGVNAFFVRADLAHHFEDIQRVPRRSQNYDGHGFGHPEHPDPAHYVELG